MKKVLFATSALTVAAALSSAALASGVAYDAKGGKNAGGLNVTVGGYVNSEAAVIDQDPAGLRSSHFTNEAEINFTVSGSAENFDYGAVIELNANVGADKDSDAGGTSDAGNADKTYIFVEGGDFGRFEFGSNAGVSDTLEVDASNIARATGGIDGNWLYYVDTLPGTGTTAVKITPNLNVADDDATGADAAKISYYTPRFSGIQAGVSYTPDTGDIGTAANLSGVDDADQFSDVVALGLNYEGEFGGVGLQAGVVWELGAADGLTATPEEDLNSYSVGAAVEFEGFSIAGNYADLGDSGLATSFSATNDDQNYTTIGAAYETGPFGVSLTYIGTEQAQSATVTNELTNYVLGADYQLAPGFTPYVEVAMFEIDGGTAGTTNDNEGNVILVGAELNF